MVLGEEPSPLSPLPILPSTNKNHEYSNGGVAVRHRGQFVDGVLGYAGEAGTRFAGLWLLRMAGVTDLVLR